MAQITLYGIALGVAECKSEVERKEMRKKAGEYLDRAEQLKEILKDLEGIVVTSALSLFLRPLQWRRVCGQTHIMT